jgi:hypothetical protein
VTAGGGFAVDSLPNHPGGAKDNDVHKTDPGLGVFVAMITIKRGVKGDVLPQPLVLIGHYVFASWREIFWGTAPKSSTPSRMMY